MEDHPGVLFRNGPAGRRAGLAGGPDVWEVIAAIRASGLESEAAVKLRLDEMLSTVIAEQLRSGGRDVVAVTERPELRGVLDPELLASAREEQRAVVTYNRDDFLALDRQYRHEGREHHGIVILNPRRFPPGEASTRALALIASIGALLGGGPPYPGFVHWLQ